MPEKVPIPMLDQPTVLAAVLEKPALEPDHGARVHLMQVPKTRFRKIDQHSATWLDERIGLLSPIEGDPSSRLRST